MAVEAGFRARAGTLTLLYVISDAERGVLRTLLAEAATGTRVQEIEPPPGRKDKYRHDVFNDSYLLEPVDPETDPEVDPEMPIGPETLVRSTSAGEELLLVASALETWLSACPGGPLPLKGDCGPAIATLVTAWSACVTHALAPEPLTVEEACGAVPTLADELVEADIANLEAHALLEAFEYDDGEVRYEPTEWLRLGIAPLAVAARMELRHPPGDTAPIAVADVEAAFHLTLPLVRLPGRFEGSCGLVVELEDEVAGGPAAVTAHVEDGRVVAIEPGLAEDADARAVAPAREWLGAVIDGAGAIEVSGERRLPRHLVDGLQQALFPEKLKLWGVEE